MNVLFVLILIAVLLIAYGAMTYSLHIAKLFEVFVFGKLRGFFKTKGVRKMKVSMQIPEKLVKYLKRHKLYYQVLVHPRTMTSSKTAEASHISGKELAKVVMARAAGADIMIVLPSDRTIDLFKLSDVLGTKDVHIEKEKEFKNLFPDCEVGAMPPFGTMYHLPCYVDENLKDKDHIYFNAGNHEECIQVSTADFLRVVNAFVGDFSVPGKMIHEKHKIAV